MTVQAIVAILLRFRCAHCLAVALECRCEHD